jgi:hypothetical protein
MARPIADTPVLRGEEALRFMLDMENVKRLPNADKRLKEMEEAYEWVKKHAAFPVYDEVKKQ